MTATELQVVQFWQARCKTIPNLTCETCSVSEICRGLVERMEGVEL